MSIEMKKHEHEVNVGERVNPGDGADLVVASTHEVILYLANGGHVRMASETPIKVFCQPEERD